MSKNILVYAFWLRYAMTNFDLKISYDIFWYKYAMTYFDINMQ